MRAVFQSSCRPCAASPGWSYRSVLGPLLLAAIAVSVAVTEIGAAETSTPWRSWQSTLHADHPLAGRIWDASDRDFVSPDALAEAVSGRDYVLIGEIHDNADHHRLQAWLIERIAGSRSPAVVMEMMDTDQATSLSEYLSGPEASAAGIGPAVAWEDSGWPEWTTYQPIGEAALNNGLSLHAGNPPRSATRSIAEGGIEGLSPDERKRLGLDDPLPAADDEALGEVMRAAHCGLLPDGAIGPMVAIQQYRDAHLARALVDANTGDGAILIAGNGHVRSDRAVPRYLASLDPERSVAVVMQIEISGGEAEARDLITRDGAGNPVADFFWFTARVDREDPCIALKERFQNGKR